MVRSVNHASQPWRTLVQRMEKPVTGLLLTLGIMAVGLPQIPAYSTTAQGRTAVAQAAGSRATGAQPAAQPLADGVYLYGQAPQAEQIGSAYMVFEVNQGKVVGAFYMPSSSFDCFYGEFHADRLALNVIDSYEQSVHPYAIALQPGDNVAMAGPETLAPVSLEGYHPINTVSANDRRILSTCKADSQRRI